MCEILNQYMNDDMIYNIYYIENDLSSNNSKKYVLSILVNLCEILNSSEQIDGQIILKFDVRKIFTKNIEIITNTPHYNKIYEKFLNNANMIIHLSTHKITANPNIKKLCSFHTNLDDLNKIYGLDWFDNEFCDLIMNEQNNSMLYWIELTQSNSDTSSSNSSMSTSPSISPSTSQSISQSTSQSTLIIDFKDNIMNDDDWTFI